MDKRKKAEREQERPFVELAYRTAFPSKRVVKVAEAERLAADIICGEVGRDEYLSFMVAHVMDNRMNDLAGRRVDKLITVLTAPRQFNGRCKIAMPEFGPYLAHALVTGEIKRFGRPVWLTPDVKWFTDEKSAARWLSWKHKPKWLRGLRKVKTVNGMVFFGKD
jgi:hypothetical protein